MFNTQTGPGDTYRALFEANGTATVVVGAADSIVLANPAFADLVGLPRAAIENRKCWTEFIEQEDLPILRNFCQSDSQGTAMTYEATLLDWAGCPKTVQVTVSALTAEGFRVFSLTRMASYNQSYEQLKKYQLLFDAVHDIVLIVAANGAILGANRAAARAYGYGKRELLSMSLHELRLYDPQAAIHGSRDEIHAKHRLFEVTGRRKDGSVFQLEVNSCSAEMMGEKIIICIGRDITKRKLQEQQLREAQKKNQALIDAIPDVLFRIGRDGRIRNCIIRPDSSYAPVIRAMIGKEIAEVLPKNTAGKIGRNITRVLKTKRLATLEYHYPGEKAALFFEARLAACGEDEILAIVRDITDRKHMEQQLQYVSFHDALTGLYNRAYFEQEMARLKLVRQGGAGIVLCDVDGLKLINDSLGHAMGDRVLREVACQIKSAFRPGDMVARIGGDEFAVLLPVDSAQTCLNACRRIHKLMERYNQDNLLMPVGLSVGYAVNEKSAASLEDLYKEADTRMYRQKLHHHQSSKSAIVDALMKALQTRDYITEGHGDRLQGLTVLIAKAIGMPDNAIPDLCLLARFHDLGKVGIPDHILFKPARMTAKEYAVMKRHSEIGYRIALSIPDLAPIADWILLHHEWWNGGGYPTGAEKNKIPLECRILAIADAFDAMTNDRPYRKAVSRKQAVAELQRCAGTQFDPELVKFFVKAL